MSMKKAIATLTLSLIACASQAELVDLGDGTVKDTAANLIWLKDWNVNNWRLWEAQNSWAQGLTFAGSSDWRLPSSGEFFTVWYAAGSSYVGLISIFNNVQVPLYHTSDDCGEFTTCGFVTYQGSVDQYRKFGDSAYAVAVRSASVSNVPESSTVAMMVLGIGVLLAAARFQSR